jgi:hypothetical protein
MMPVFLGLVLKGTMVVLGSPPSDTAFSPMELILGRRPMRFAKIFYAREANRTIGVWEAG